MHNKKYGFTLVEIIIIITVIGILSTIGVVTYNGAQAKSRDSQREARATLIANSLEKYYEDNGEYPSCSAFADNPSGFLTDLKPEVFQTPTSTSNSIKCSNPSEEISTSLDFFTYQYDNENRSWELWYISEIDNTIYSIDSKYSNND